MHSTLQKTGASKVPFDVRIDFTMSSLLDSIRLVQELGLAQVEFTSKGDPGLKAVVYRSGRIVFYTRYRHQGRRLRWMHGELGLVTLDHVRQGHWSFRQKLGRGLTPGGVKTAAMTYSELFHQHYVVQCQSRGKLSLAADVSRNKHWLEPELGTRLLTEINVTMISGIVMMMKAGDLQPSTINKTISTLSTVLQVAVDMDLLAKNPAKRIKPLRVNNLKTEFLTVHDMRRLITAAEACGPAEKVGGCYVRLAAYTAARVRECLDAKHADIDLESGVWRLSKQKSGKPGVIHLSDAAKQVIRELIALRRNDYLFPGQRGNARLSRPIKLFKRLCVQAGLGDQWTPHALRHGFCSAAVHAGIPLEIVSHAARHSSPVVTRIYSHPHQEALQAANEAVAKLISDARVA